jgi:signal transduction histidine kinase
VRSAKRLSALIDDFLDVQAIEQDRLALMREPLFAGHSAAHALRLPASESPVTAVGDRARIAQVVANLLSKRDQVLPERG